ncbi:MAG: 3-oxoacyl-[acyl-carrier protein] reductase [Solirubrobacteraceae bacterium]|jgi:NAD(P)-dependent dehydrogenase (short-subunit alcohol dehydrogenase family)|nr:3-oxoacyl-[acyl-carrier protein] reductase [Solirubrobacteraceae bacterium]
MSPRDQGCAVVTGGTRGIGAAIAERLEEAGWDVARLGRADADIADREAVAAAFDRVRGERGPILVLVNNAGIRADGLAISMGDDDWTSVVDTNLTGAFHCTKAALPDMLRARFGRIVNVSSVVAERANPGQANYVAAKAGLLGLTRTVAREMARKGVTCNAVTPGVIATDMTADLNGDLAGTVPAGRVGRPEEVAAAVSFLVSDEAAYVNGATLSVDGALGA